MEKRKGDYFFLLNSSNFFSRVKKKQRDYFLIVSLFLSLLKVNTQIISFKEINRESVAVGFYTLIYFHQSHSYILTKSRRYVGVFRSRSIAHTFNHFIDFFCGFPITMIVITFIEEMVAITIFIIKKMGVVDQIHKLQIIFIFRKSTHITIFAGHTNNIIYIFHFITIPFKKLLFFPFFYIYYIIFFYKIQITILLPREKKKRGR